jgi:hypothetical protein
MNVGTYGAMPMSNASFDLRFSNMMYNLFSTYGNEKL